MSWNWDAFAGDPTCLKYSRRDLQILERALRHVPGRTAAVQAGANLGVFPRRLAELFETVYTFEPAPQLFAATMHNAPAANIVKLQAAVGESHKLIALSRARRDGSSKPEHDGLTHVSGPGAIPCLCIDDLALPVCDLIYLDVEGFELYALRGARETVRRCRPVIGVEVNSAIEHSGASARELREWIRLHGYVLAFGMHSDEIYVPAG